MFRTKSLSAKEMKVLASDKGHRKESQENKKSSLRSLIADKTVRYHQHLQKFALTSFMINRSISKKSPHTSSLDPYSWKKKRQDMSKESFEVKQFETSAQEVNVKSFKDNISEQNKENYESPLSKYLMNSIEEVSEIEGSPQQLKEDFNILKQYCSYLQTENSTFRDQIQSIRNHFAKQAKQKDENMQKDKGKLEDEVSELRKQNETLMQKLKQFKKKRNRIKLSSNIVNQVVEIKQKNLKMHSQIVSQNLMGKEKNETSIQTSLLSSEIQQLFNEKIQLCQYLQKQTDNGIGIRETIEKKIDEEKLPLIEEMQKLKKVEREKRVDLNSKIKLYGSLLVEAHKEIQTLLGKLRQAKQESIQSFKEHLQRERAFSGIKLQIQQ